MEPSIDQLSRKDRAFLERLKKVDVPYWRKPIGGMLVVLGFLMLMMQLVERLLQVVHHNGPLFFTGVIGLLAGAMQLQKARYQRIVHRVLIDADGPENGTVEAEPGTDALSRNDRKLLEAVGKSPTSFWRKPVGWLLIALGFAVLALCVLATLLDVGGGPFLLIGIIMLLAGSIELQEVRYRRVLHHLLIEPDGNAATTA